MSLIVYKAIAAVTLAAESKRHSTRSNTLGMRLVGAPRRRSSV